MTVLEKGMHLSHRQGRWGQQVWWVSWKSCPWIWDVRKSLGKHVPQRSTGPPVSEPEETRQQVS